ncbi:MAG: hypothetical protein ACREN1_07015 [Candidatus Dormibacteria bacterium]
MNSQPRRSRSASPIASLRSGLERLLEPLRDLARGTGPGLRPALIPIPIGQGPHRSPAPAETALHLAFGRKRENKAEGGEDDEDDEDESTATADRSDSAVGLPPIPSALGGADPEQQEDESLEDPAESWRPLSSSADEAVSPIEDPEDAADPGEPEVTSWSPEVEVEPETPATTDADDADPVDSRPWGSAPDAGETTTFSPAVVRRPEETSEDLAWLGSGSSEPSEPWGIPAEPAAAPGGNFPDPVAELEEVDEIEPETPQGEALGGGPEGLDSLSEVLTTAGTPWTSSIPVAEPPAVISPPPPRVAPDPTAELGAIRTRSFPLPEGEMVFRNLRAGFTDPARLLRHLAGEGHTGVLHVQAVDGSNSYVVLVDGYVVAVATDHQGVIATTNRITFPNFPNSQDTINVITYSRQIARGLGLLLHAPLRFEGLGAMFVNLEGLRTYLSKYSSSGGLVVHSQEGTGVALFEEGKLVGAYADSNPPSADLGQLRELVKDLEAEIDVRFGGPRDLEPTPLDTLLSGHPL